MKINKGCNACDNYQIGKININKPDESHKCSIGNDIQFNKWWKENGHKSHKEQLTDMICFKETKFGEFLIKSNDILDKMLTIVDNENK